MSGPREAPRRLAEGGGSIAALLRRVPEPPADEVAGERIWRRLLRSLPARRRLAMGWLVQAAGLASLAAVLFWWSRSAPLPLARLELASGSVLAAAPRREYRAAHAGAALAEATRLRTDAQGRAIIGLARARVLVTPSTEVALESLGAATFLRLSAGGLVAEVAPRRGGESFVVQTTRWRVAVKGTVFEVREKTPDDVTVSVGRGLVEVSGEGGVFEVAAGKSWRSIEPARFGDDDIAPADRALLGEEVRVEPPPPAARLESVPAPAPAVRVPRAPRREPERLAMLERAPPPSPPPSFPPVPAPPVVPAADPYPRALALARAGKAREAADALAVIVAARGPHADLALYDLARLRRRELGDSPGAIRALLQYERDYPGGPLSQEVELSAIELLLSAPDLPRARAQMDRFLARHPESERAPEVHLLRGNLLRGSGRCKEALPDYRQAQGDGTDDDALYFRAYCEQQLGRTADAARSLHDYLARFPRGRHAAEVHAALRAGR